MTTKTHFLMLLTIVCLILFTIIPGIYMACWWQPTIEEVREKIRTADTCRITDTRTDREKCHRLKMLGKTSFTNDTRTMTKFVLSDREVLHRLAESTSFTKAYGDCEFSSAERMNLAFLRNNTTVLHISLLRDYGDGPYGVGVFYFPDSGRSRAFQCALSLHKMVRQLIDNRDPDGTMAAYKKAIKLNPNNAKAYNNLAKALIAKEDFDGAITAFNKAIKLNPKDARAYYNLGTVLGVKGDTDGEIAAYKKAIESNPAFADPYNSLAMVLYFNGDANDAIAKLQKAIEVNPNDAMAYCNIGYILSFNGDANGAIVNFKKAIEVDPKCVTAYLNLVGEYCIKKDYDKALEVSRIAQNKGLKKNTFSRLTERIIKASDRKQQSTTQTTP